MEFKIEPYERIVIHELVEYALSDLIDLILIGTQAAGGTTIPLVQWADGVVIQIQSFNPNSDVIIGEQMKGTVHYASVRFARKEAFEKEIHGQKGTVRLIDASASPTIRGLASFLNDQSKSSP